MVNRARDRKLRSAGKEKRKSSFVYKKRDPESVRKRAEQTGGRFDSPFKQGVDTWRPKAGDNQIRFLPPTWDGHDHYAYDIWVHPYVGPDNSTYLCPSKMKGKACPICDAQREAKDAGEADEAKALAPRKQMVAWILDRNENEETPQLYMMSWTVDRDISALVYDKKTGRALYIDHPEEGFDVSFKRQGAGLKTKYYGWNIDRESTPISEDEAVTDEIQAFLEENPIPSVLNYYDTAYLERVISGTSESKDDELDEDDEDEKPKKKKAKVVDEDDEDEDERPVKRTRRPKDEDEDDEEEDEKPKARKSRRDEDEDEDEEDEKPTRTRRSKARDEDEDEDEEDEKPARTRRSKSRDEDEDEDDEEEKPKARSKRGKAEDDDEEEAEDEDDDVEEEDDDEEANEEREARASKKRRRS